MEAHYYGLEVVHVKKRYMIGAACSPNEEGIEVRVLVKSPVPKDEMPEEIAELWEGWLGDVKTDYFSKAKEDKGRL
jgi:hypothetical protein